MKSPKLKPVAPRRSPPDLPATLESCGSPFAQLDVTLAEQHLQSLAQPGLRLQSFHLEGCLLEQIALSKGEFSQVVWKDVRLVDCDLANGFAHRISLVRVELVRCRLTGFRASAVEARDVLLEECDLRYAQWRGAEFRGSEFARCNFEDADLQEADLGGCALRASNLKRVDLRRAKLRDTDLRDSEVEEMAIDAGDLQGAIVNPAQAMVFARLLGLKIL